MNAIQTLRQSPKGRESQNQRSTDNHGNELVVQQTNITEVVNVTKEIVQVVPANPQVV
jgi:hypothetical protein